MKPITLMKEIANILSSSTEYDLIVELNGEYYKVLSVSQKDNYIKIKAEGESNA
jgi:hypothetical protein